MTQRIAVLASIAGLLAISPILAQWPTYTVERPFDWEVSTPEGSKGRSLPSWGI